MESESTDDPAAREAPLVFISDASAEAERVSLALSARGWHVADVPLALLAGRTTVQRPALVICDADAEGAQEALSRIREQSREDPVDVVVVGDRDGALASIDAALVRAVFARPVNIPELVGTVERLVGGGADPASLIPPSKAKVGTSSRPPLRPSVQALTPLKPVSPRAETADGALALPPELAGEPIAMRGAPSEAPVVELSGEIQALLLAAERKLGGERETASAAADDPGPEVDFEAALPPDVLAALEDPLDEDEEAVRSSEPEPILEGTAIPSGPSGTPMQAPPSLVAAAAGQTHAGTQATSLGSDAMAPPPSHPQHASLSPRLERTSVQASPPDARRSETPLSGDPRSGTPQAEEERQRQQASTPRPPRPGTEDLLESDSPEGEPLLSLPPPTTFDASLDASIGEPESERPAARFASPPAALPHPSEPALRAPTLDYGRADERAREGPATTPPARSASRSPGTQVDGEPAPPRDERTSDLPVQSRGAFRVGDVPSAPLATMDGYPESERSGPSFAELERPLPARPSHPAGSFAAPPVLRSGDAAVTLARAIRDRHSGALAFEVDEGIRRVVLREGDFVTAASGVHGESLVAFLAARGDLPPEVARQGHKLPAFGRRAGAALIAHGHLAQDQLWPVLRAHAEWIIGKIATIERGAASAEPLGRLEDEPAVFGGATGAEVLVEVLRRVLPPEEAVARLGGPGAVLSVGPARNLLDECALPQHETELVLNADGATLAAVVDGPTDPSLASVIYALVALGGLSAQAARAAPELRPAPVPRDELDDQALRARILSRKALIDEGDYFAVLGVPRTATAYDIRRAYAALRSEFEPNRALSASTADLGDVLDEILQVLDEAHEILSDGRRRERYRRAIEATP